MTRVRVFLTAALLSLCLAPAAVNAAPFTPELNFAYRLAVEHWGEPTGCITVDAEIVPDAFGKANEFRGWATMPAPGEQTNCILDIIRELAKPSYFGAACAVIFHEVGHLTGHDHSNDPHSIMYPEVTFAPSACSRAMLWLMNHERRF